MSNKEIYMFKKRKNMIPNIVDKWKENNGKISCSKISGSLNIKFRI